VKAVWVEGLLVAVVGAALAFAANALSPLGLKLTHDYFPGAPLRPPPPTNPVQRASDTNSTASSATELLAARLKDEGLDLIDGKQALELFHDPRREMDLVVFVDARISKHYQDGHIPGAYQFDRYRYEDYLPSIKGLCEKAERVVVYCTGGDCEDSEFAAKMLRDAGVSKEKLFVYGGGITEWAASSLPIETGARNSGQLRNPGK